jgi:hypothetical protein
MKKFFAYADENADTVVCFFYSPGKVFNSDQKLL